ncbi:DUF2937 family protein [Pseudomarimonas arenosa]|uniref:DUF2937 family protein n=1 Tax=Pseudomarimonas arenosa TaxID=2774145 RepID=A0AAW3ZEX5_9GAMM|nr:DUF2937 family protein [Pseudomarimonas arenosa]MBD8524468.1 DUF2937 family protein [Pseudomarimonas arenosa]
MRAVLGLLDRLWLLACVLAAGCLPGFILQYRQRMLGRLDQVSQDLAPWRQIAERYHQGSLPDLIAHHRASADATFMAEAEAIELMVKSEASLQAVVDALQGSLLQQALGLVQYAHWADVQAVWSIYQPTFSLDPEGLAFALLLGALLWFLPVAVIGIGRRLQRRRRATADAAGN